LVTSVELAAGAADLAVPPLLLQPLVENAILHGLHERAAGSVHVSAERIGERVVIRVRDDGPGPTNSKHAGTQTSVADLRKRVQLAFGDTAAVTLTDSATGGCIAEVSLPCAH
jgi:sensor histidine kinase YesM